MPRKMKVVPDGYDKAFPRNLRKLLADSKTTKKELAISLDRSGQAISYYCDGSSSPDWETLVKIAQYFSVSTDYLLGVSTEKSVDQTVQSVCKYIGLSSSTVSQLHYQPDPSIRSFYRRLFDSIVQIGEDGLEKVPEKVRQAAEAHVIAKRKPLDRKHPIENSKNAISIDSDGTYKISAKYAEDFFLTEAQAEICKCLANVLGDMEEEVINTIEAFGTISAGDFKWGGPDEETEDYTPRFPD